jgi:hypothetical protein
MFFNSRFAQTVTQETKMKIKRFHHQLEGSSGKTLEDFYIELARDYPHFADCSDAMLMLLARLQSLPDPREFIALTSHSRLCFICDDSPDAFWYYLVEVSGGKNGYHISCRMPDRIAPWQEAEVEGMADSVDQAISMILKAIDYSEGWSSEDWSYRRLQRSKKTQALESKG